MRNARSAAFAATISIVLIGSSAGAVTERADDIAFEAPLVTASAEELIDLPLSAAAEVEPAQVPVPATLVLLMTGCLGLILVASNEP